MLRFFKRRILQKSSRLLRRMCTAWYLEWHLETKAIVVAMLVMSSVMVRAWVVLNSEWRIYDQLAQNRRAVISGEKKSAGPYQVVPTREDKYEEEGDMATATTAKPKRDLSVCTRLHRKQMTIHGTMPGRLTNCREKAGAEPVVFSEDGVLEVPRSSNVKCTYREVLSNANVTDEFVYGVAMTLEPGLPVQVRTETITVNCKNDYPAAPSHWTSHYRWISMQFLTDERQPLVPLAPPIDAQRNVDQDGSLSSVLVFAIDSVSRYMMHEYMPKTLLALELSGGIELTNFNIVADGTTGNLLPLFTGLGLDEVPYEVRQGVMGARPLDDLPWIFHDLHKRGIPTFFDEDAMNPGAFTYRLTGFEKPMTVVYNRDYRHVLRATNKPLYKELFTNKSKPNPAWECTGSRHVLEEMFDNLMAFYNVYHYSTWPVTFAFSMITDFTHDYNKIACLDEVFSDRIYTLKTKDFFESVTLIVMSDHGPRIRKDTVQGAIEERIPYVNIVLPTRTAHQGNKRSSSPAILFDLKQRLRSNADALTTSYDLHVTLRHLLLTEPQALRYAGKSSIARSVLTKFPVNEARNCDTLSIASHFCTCLMLTPIELTNENKLSKIAASLFVRSVNGEIRKYGQLASNCRTLSLVRVRQTDIVYSEDKAVFFRVVIETAPGNAVYEFTMPVILLKAGQIQAKFGTLTTLADHLVLGASMMRRLMSRYSQARQRLVEQSSRLDRYGARADCIDELLPAYNRFCYCKYRE